MGERLAAKALLDIGEAVKPFTVQIVVFSRSKSSPINIITSGTGGLIDTGARRLLVTARHVVEAFTGPNHDPAIVGEAPPPLAISEWPVIDMDSKVDIAAVEVPSSFDAGEIGRRFCPVNWPPPRAIVGETVFFVGYPGLHRDFDGRVLVQSASPFCDGVTSVSERHFILVDEELNRKSVSYAPGLPEFGSLGGMSGALVFAWRDGTEVPVGVLYEGDETKHATIFVAHLDFLSADGMIDRSRILW